jgi:CubicO group peptidase (beta-lactamase class C family)
MMLKIDGTIRRLGLVAAFALLTSTPPAQTQPAAGCAAPDAMNDGWATASPESVNLDGALLCAMGARLKLDEADVHAVIVVRHGKLVFEQYFRGYDDPWGAPEGTYDFDATTKHDLRSISKSVTSLMLGIAIDRKLIASIDDPVIKFFPPATVPQAPGWDRVTLRHLISMSSGMSWDENLRWTDPANDEPHLGNEADPIRYVLAKPILSAPGTIWNYNGGGIDLLGEIIARASGKSFNDFAREALFEPLGISDWEWKTYENGRVSPAAGLRLRPRDAAKIGLLMLNHGSWNGKTVVSADWIAQSETPRFQTTGYFGGLFYFGYAWWMGRTLTGETETKWIAGIGLGGQRLFIVPDLDIVMMSTSGLYTSPRQGVGALDVLNNFVIASALDKNQSNMSRKASP